ncbi:hypothetical protein [Kitasatospora azatica]|uniref:hypothetical protein n=1 Tax=Kitasatospora azatica TaxID=58347 RepID=UPI000690232C|nr:hypothetical protein [Kitasatospora azatica]
MPALHRGRLLVLAAVVFALIGCTAGAHRAAGALPVFDGAGCGSAQVLGGFQVGVTHTEHSIGTGVDPTAPPPAPAAVARAKRVLSSVGPLQNMHIFGFGEWTAPRAPAQGAFNWSALDARMRLICATGGTPVITLCCSPSWATDHYDPAAPNDDTHLYEAPLPTHYQDYADLAVAIARHFPFVRYYQVWNEFKGFYGVPRPDGTTDYSQWNHRAYTDFYNTVYRALDGYRRAARQDLRIGGPYLPFPSWDDPGAAGHPATDPELAGQPWGTVDQRAVDSLDYWLAHSAGADFLAVDAGTDTEPACPPGVSDCPDDQKYRRFPTPAQGAAKFRTLDHWLHTRLSRTGRSRLPIWWSEFYAPVDGGNGSTGPAFRGVLSAMASSGAAVALLWGPEYQPNTSTSCHNASGHLECSDGFPALWTEPTVSGGGDPPPGPDYLTILRQLSGPGRVG